MVALSKTYSSYTWVSNALKFRGSAWLMCYEHSKFTRGILADWWMTFQISCSFASLQLVGLGVFVCLRDGGHEHFARSKMKQHWTKIFSNSQCGTSNDFREACINMFCFPMFLPTTLREQTLEVATQFLSIRGFTRATTCCVTRRVPWCAVWPCRSWIITVW